MTQSCNFRLREVRGEILLCVFEELEAVQALVETHLTALHTLLDGVGQLDFYLALADFAIEAGACVRPVVKTEGTTILREVRHPLLESNMSLGRFTPVSVDLSSGSLHVVTSPNGGGKTTLLKTVATAQILAQIGCPVPATSAEIVIVNQLMTRFGSDSDASLSTFQTEMRDVAQVLAAATPQTLVLFDEVGRGTSLSDGMGISWAACEHLLSRRATSVVATHYFELTRLATTYPGLAMNISLSCDVANESITPFFRVTPGPSSVYSAYGLICAAQHGFPSSALREARKNLELLNAIDRKWNDSFFGDEEDAGFKLYNLIVNASPDSVIGLLKRMQCELF